MFLTDSCVNYAFQIGQFMYYERVELLHSLSRWIEENHYMPWC